jgi:hypothetical protein
MKTKPKWSGLLLTALAAAILATGCSKAEQIVKEAEKAVEEDSLTVTYDNGKEVTFSEKEDIPDLFPSDVPLPEGIQVLSSISSKDNVTVMIETEMPYEEVVELYVDYAQQAGYEEVHRLETGTSINYSTQRGTERFVVTLGLNEEDNKTTEGVLVYSNKPEQPEE